MVANEATNENLKDRHFETRELKEAKQHYSI